jgi:hypothetical protein
MFITWTAYGTPSTPLIPLPLPNGRRTYGFYPTTLQGIYKSLEFRVDQMVASGRSRKDT